MLCAGQMNTPAHQSSAWMLSCGKSEKPSASARCFCMGAWHADVYDVHAQISKLFIPTELMRRTWRWQAAESGDQYRIGKKFFQ